MGVLFPEQDRLCQIHLTSSPTTRTHPSLAPTRRLTFLVPMLRIMALASERTRSECDGAGDKRQSEAYSQRWGDIWRCAEFGEYLAVRGSGAGRYTGFLEGLQPFCFR
jgi:hypothetical protein